MPACTNLYLRKTDRIKLPLYALFDQTVFDLYAVGAMTMLASNVLFSQGPWTPWQMFAMGISGFLAGVLFRKGLLRRTRSSMCVFGALCAIVVYGGIMNPASVLLWGGGSINAKMILTYYITGFPMDCIHAFARCFSYTSPQSPCSKSSTA